MCLYSCLCTFASLSMSGAKCSEDPNVHVELMYADAREISSWASVEGDLGVRRGSKVLYVSGVTPSQFGALYNKIYKPYKAAAGADAEPFPSYANLSAAHKKDRASRLGRESKAYGYVPHNNNVPTQAARRAEGIYDGADLFAALTGIGQ